MNVAIDFNDTLCDRQNVDAGQRLGKPLDGAQEALINFQKQGHKLYIFTDMADTTKGYNAVADWLHYFNMPWDYITNTKPRNLLYFIDDKAIRFTSWQQVLVDIDKVEV